MLVDVGNVFSNKINKKVNLENLRLCYTLTYLNTATTHQ